MTNIGGGNTEQQWQRRRSGRRLQLTRTGEKTVHTGKRGDIMRLGRVLGHQAVAVLRAAPTTLSVSHMIDA